MKCPICVDTDLVMSERSGVEIDYCPKCRGVWLDRGELDKIIEKNSMAQNNPPIHQQQVQNQRPYNDYDRKQYSEGYGKYNDEYYKKRKKRGFLGDLFDFD